MKRLFAVPVILSLTGCAGMGSSLLEKTMLCDVVSVSQGVIKGRLTDGATVQDYPENGYFVYTVNGMNHASQSPVLVNGYGEYNDIVYMSMDGSYEITNKSTGNTLIIERCRKAF